MAKDLSKSVADLEKDVEDLFKKIVAVGKDLDTVRKRAEDDGDVFEGFGDAIEKNEEAIKRVEDKLGDDIKEQSTGILLLGKKLNTTNEITDILQKVLETKASEDGVESLRKSLDNRIEKLDAETNKEIAETKKEIYETNRVIETATSKQDERMDKVDDKMDKIVARMDKIDFSIATLERYNEEQAHTKRIRTAMKDDIAKLEANIERYQSLVSPETLKSMSDQIKKLEKDLKATRA